MAFESFTDNKIEDLINCPKSISNPLAKSKSRDGSNQINYKVYATDKSGRHFVIFTRQNTRNGMEDDFSCGIYFVSTGGETLMLKRYNGKSHNHPNHIEGDTTGYHYHIHIATERYIKANKKPEGFAEATTRYKTLEGALHCLVSDCNVSGILTQPDIMQGTLFD